MNGDAATAMTSLTARLRERFDELTRNEQVLAKTILEFPGDVASYTATELAELAGVSKMTVTRLVRRLGFENYDQARLASRAATTHGSPLHRLRSANGPSDSTSSFEDHLLQCVSNIEQTARTIDRNVFARVVENLATAPRIWILGFRNGANLASYARWQLTQLRSHVHLNSQAAETIGETLSDIQPKDLLLLVGSRRRPNVFPRVVEAARARKATLVYIGDAHSAIGTSVPELSLLCMTRSLFPLDNHVAILGIIHALAASLFDRIGPQARQRIQEVGELQEKLGEI